MFLNQEIVLKFKANQPKTKGIFNDSGGSSTIKWSMTSSDENIFHLEWNTATIKNIVNKVSGKQFHTQSENIDRLISFLISESNDLIDIEVGPEKDSLQQYIVKNTLSPFGIKGSDFKELMKNNPQLAAQFEARIRDFIFNKLCAGASQYFIDTVEDVLGQKIKDSTYAFFMGGDNWVTHAVGAFGELQTVILFQYISKRTPNKILATKIGEIIGDKGGIYGQQLRSDVELLKAFGIQVKNYSGDINRLTGEERTITINFHPTEIASLPGGATDYLLNSYFNSSIPKYTEGELEDFFESHAMELLNLDFHPSTQNTVSFYMIGLNLIPGSAILKAAYQKATIKASTVITSGFNEQSDEGYNPWINNPSYWGSPFVEWWHSIYNPPIKGAFTPKSKNTLSTLDKLVSIRTKFTYSALFGGAYQLF